MNKTTTHSQTILLRFIVPSPFNPRKHFDEVKLAELAASIKEKGVLEPILVRPTTLTPLPGAEYDQGALDQQYYEIVAGERRFRAAKAAEQTEIPAIVSDFSDSEAAEIAIIENAQRADLTPVEEARGFQMLVEQFGHTVEDAALKMGLSAKTVAQRIRLLNLPEKALEALDEGDLPLGSAVHLSRLADEKLRAEAVEIVLKGSWETDGKPLTPNKTLNLIRNRFMTELSAAVFPTADETLLPSAGACTKCPHRSGAQADLFEGVGKKDLCLNTTCFAEKKKAFAERQLAEARAKNLIVLDAKSAKSIFPYGSHVAHNAAYVDANETYYTDQSKPGGKPKTFKSLVGKAIEPVIAVDPVGGVHTLYPKDAVKTVLKGKGIEAKDLDPASSGNGKSAEQKQQELKERADKTAFIEALQLIRVSAKSYCPKFTTPGQRTIWRAIINGYLRQIWDDHMKVLAKALEIELGHGHVSNANQHIRNWLATASDEDAYVAGLLISVIRLESSYYGSDPERKKPMLLALEELGIDLKALRAQHLAQLKQKANGKSSAKKPAAKKTVKPTKAKGGKRESAATAK